MELACQYGTSHLFPGNKTTHLFIYKSRMYMYFLVKIDGGFLNISPIKKYIIPSSAYSFGKINLLYIFIVENI